MAEYDNTNRGAIFREEEKESDNHPDYSGSLNVEGEDYYVSGWIKTSKAGKKFLSLSVKPKGKKVEARTHRAVAGMKDDIPFADPYKGRKSYVF